MILVVAEQKDGKLNRASWEAIAGAQQLAESGAAGPITVAVTGNGVQSVAAELAAADVSAVLAADDAALGTYTPDAFVQAVQQLIAQTTPRLRGVSAHVSDARLRADARGASRSRARHRRHRGEERERRAGVCAADVPGQADRGRGA